MPQKEKYQLEFVINTSTKVLYNMLSTPSGLSEWFADDVNLRDDVYTFLWDGSEEKARKISAKSGEAIKFQWLEDEEEGIKSFFELRIAVDDITKDVAILVTDFAEEDEMEESQLLWENQIAELKHVLGS
jgi:uncharacterized protein YndB with AHSA1/START domain